MDSFVCYEDEQVIHVEKKNTLKYHCTKKFIYRLKIAGEFYKLNGTLRNSYCKNALMNEVNFKDPSRHVKLNFSSAVL